MIDKSLLKLPGVRKLFPLLAGLAIFQALTITGQALFLSASLTGLWQGKTFQTILFYALGFFACFFLRELVVFGRQKLLDGFAYKLSRDLRKDLLDKIFQLGPRAVTELGSGATTSTVIAGIDQVENYIKLVLSKVLSMMIVPVLLLIVVFFLDWQSALVLLIAFPFAIIFMILLGYTAQARARRQYHSYQLLSNHFLDSLRGISILKYFGRSKDYANSIYRTSEEFRKATMKTLSVAILSTFSLDFFSTLSVATVALFLGLRLLSGNILLFPALAALILAPEYFLPLREFASDYHATLNGKNALASINKLLDTPSDLKNKLAAPLTWTENSSLSLQSLTKHYEEDSSRGIEKVNFSLTGYQKVAIVGASGAGKSTLLSLLAGFLNPSEGEIILNGQTLSSLQDENYRQSLCFIPQQTYIFSGTLKQNVAFYQPQASDADIEKALKMAGLDQLGLSLDEKIGAGSRSLSGGQMQRIALARAFLSNNRKILLLDEPTAHLDIQTELEIKENILPLFENKLVFLATHRLHWIQQMDMVIVLNEGKVEGVGSHEELLATNAYYRKLLEDIRL